MKVLLCSPKGNTGGIARWTSHILDYYSHNVHDVELKWCYAAPSKRDMLATTPKPIRLFYGIVNYFPFLKQLNKELHNGYDIVHFVSSGSMGLIRDFLTLKICKRHNTSAVVHFRFGRIPVILEQKNWENKLINYIVRHSSKVIVIDKSSYVALQNYGYKNIYLLPNPLTPKINEIIKRNSGLVRKSRQLLFAGHCVPTKGIYELVDACKQIPNIHLVMIGICDDNTKRDLYHRLGKGSQDWLDIKGDQPYEEVITEMLKCNVFVLPTYTEGFPNVIIESMACGCPIVTTPVGAIPEMLNIDNDTPCGIVVPIKDCVALKDAIENLLNNSEYCIRLGKSAQQRVNTEYTMSVVWQKLINIWNS